MSLDLTRTAAQISNMTSDIRARQTSREIMIQNALRNLEQFPLDEFQDKVSKGGNSTWGLPKISKPPATRHSTSETPDDFNVVATDGSHIGVDRHMPVRCFLINSGVSILTYGAIPNAKLYNSPKLFARDEEIVMRDEVTYREQTIEGAVLSAKRSLLEIRALSEAVRDLPANVPTLGLLDGSLTILGLVGQGFPEFVLQELIEDGFVYELEQLKLIANDRLLAIASYISLPAHFEIINAMRLMSCDYDDDSERQNKCGTRGPGTSPCTRCVGGLLDREVFWKLLEPGERSQVFETSSRTIDEYYHANNVCFFYINTGEEIGRVELPSWTAKDKKTLDLVHSVILDQCKRGRGYPISLMEAHEQAVISGADRRYFVRLVEKAMQNEGMTVYTSEKARSKQLRWL